MNKLTKFYLNDQTRFSLPKYKKELREDCLEILGKAEVVRIEDKYYPCWIKYGKKSHNGGIVMDRLYYFSDGRVDNDNTSRYSFVREPLPENPITLDNYKKHLDYLKR